MYNGFVGTYCRRSGAAAVPTGDKIPSGGEEDTAVHSVDTKIPTGGEEDAAVRSVDTKVSTGGDDKATVRSPERLSLRPVCIFACGKTLLLRPTLSNMSRCNHFFAVVMNPLFLIFLLVRPALSSFKGIRVRGSRFCCYRYRRFYDD